MSDVAEIAQEVKTGLYEIHSAIAPQEKETKVDATLIDTKLNNSKELVLRLDKVMEAGPAVDPYLEDAKIVAGEVAKCTVLLAVRRYDDILHATVDAPTEDDLCMTAEEATRLRKEVGQIDAHLDICRFLTKWMVDNAHGIRKEKREKNATSANASNLILQTAEKMHEVLTCYTDMSLDGDVTVTTEKTATMKRHLLQLRRALDDVLHIVVSDGTYDTDIETDDINLEKAIFASKSASKVEDDFLQIFCNTVIASFSNRNKDRPMRLHAVAEKMKEFPGQIALLRQKHLDWAYIYNLRTLLPVAMRDAYIEHVALCHCELEPHSWVAYWRSGTDSPPSHELVQQALLDVTTSISASPSTCRKGTLANDYITTVKLVFEDTSKHAATLLADIDKYLAGSESNVIEDLVDRLCMKQHTKAKITHGDGDYVEKVTFWPKGVCSTGEPFAIAPSIPPSRVNGPSQRTGSSSRRPQAISALKVRAPIWSISSCHPPAPTASPNVEYLKLSPRLRA